jgi:hypothetical protein
VPPHAGEPTLLPPIVRDVLRSPGQPLDPGTRVQMESRFGHDFARVRVHVGDRATESARMIQARAYAVGDNVVLGARPSLPTSGRSLRLLAHELAHVVQQRRDGTVSAVEAERRAELAAEHVARDRSISPARLGGAAPGLWRAEGDEQETRGLPAPPPAFAVGWDEVEQRGRLPRLPPPQVLAAIHHPGLQAHERRPLVSSGSFRLALRLGFPEAMGQAGTPERLQRTLLHQAQILGEVVKGQVPSSWQALGDPALARALWRLLSTQIGPSLAQNINTRLVNSAGPMGASYELNMTLWSEFSSAGVSFKVEY